MKYASIKDKLSFLLFGKISDKPEFRTYLNELKAKKEEKMNKQLITRSIQLVTWQ